MARHREFDEDITLGRALDVFWKRGYVGAGVQELCGAMGLNPGSVYGAYGNKRALFLAAMRRYLEDVAREGIDLIAASPSGIAGITAYFDYVVDGIVRGRRRWGCFGTNAFMELSERDADVRAVMTGHFERLEAAFRDALVRDGMAGSRAADQACYLVCVAQGLNVMARACGDRSKLATIVSQALASVTIVKSI